MLRNRSNATTDRKTVWLRLNRLGNAGSCIFCSCSAARCGGRNWSCDTSAAGRVHGVPCRLVILFVLCQEVRGRVKLGARTRKKHHYAILSMAHSRHVIQARLIQKSRWHLTTENEEKLIICHVSLNTAYHL